MARQETAHLAVAGFEHGRLRLLRVRREEVAGRGCPRGGAAFPPVGRRGATAGVVPKDMVTEAEWWTASVSARERCVELSKALQRSRALYSSTALTALHTQHPLQSVAAARSTLRAAARRLEAAHPSPASSPARTAGGVKRRRHSHPAHPRERSARTQTSVTRRRDASETVLRLGGALPRGMSETLPAALRGLDAPSCRPCMGRSSGAGRPGRETP